jgi:hypothetical protein
MHPLLLLHLWQYDGHAKQLFPIRVKPGRHTMEVEIVDSKEFSCALSNKYTQALVI